MPQKGNKQIIQVGGGGSAGTPASSVATEVSYGQASAVGVGTDYARNDHTHGTPPLPTKAQVGLGSADNTSDANKPISTATQTALDGKSATGHTHGVATGATAGFMSASDKTKLDNVAITQPVDLDAIEIASHSHSNKALLDTYTQTEANLADAVAKKHAHANLAILDATTASFTTTDETKLDGVAAGAEVNVNADWNATSGDAQILNKPAIPTQAWVQAYLPVYSVATLPVANLPWHLFTHLAYFSVAPTATGGVVNSGNGNMLLYMADLVKTAHAKGKKVIITIGGGAGIPETDWRGAVSATYRATFVANIVNYLNTHNLDGVDIDWEPFTTESDKTNLALFVADLRTALGASKVITMFLNIGPAWKVMFANDIKQHIDRFGLSTYDLAYSSPTVAIHDSPLYSGGGQPAGLSSVDAISTFVTAGVPKEKLCIAIPQYARHYTSATAIYASATHDLNNTTAYKALTGVTATTAPTGEVYDNTAKGAYTVSGGALKTYNSPDAVYAKMDYIRNNGIGGAIVWQLEQGYFAGADEPFPVIAPLAGLVGDGSKEVGVFMKGVDDTDDITEGATKKFATASEKAKLGFISVTQAVDLDAIETNANNVPAIKTKTDFITVTQAVNLDTMEGDITTKQPLDAGLTSISALTGAGYVKATANDTFSQVATIPNTDITGLGTLATQNGTFSGTHSGTSSGTNTGDQTSILGITGTKAQYNTSLTDGDFMYAGDAPTAHTHTLANVTDVTMTVANLNSLDDGVNSTLHFHNTDRDRANHTGTQLASTISDFTEASQDAIGAMVDTSLTYVDGTPLLQRSALTGAITASAGSNTTALGSFTTAQINTALSDNDIATGGGTATGTNTGNQTIANTSNATSHTVTLSATGGSVQLVEGANITLTTTGTGADGIVTIASTGVGGATNLAFTPSATDGIVTSDTGTDATVPLGNGTNSGLSLNDYTTAEKNKLSGIATGAEVNVNADWNSVSGDSQILNKPTISGTNTGDNAVNTLYSGLVSNATHTGEVTGATALTITADAVTNTKLANMATATIKGRTTAGTGDPEDLTPTQAKTVLAITNTDVSGLGTLATQSGTFSGTHSGTSSGTNTGDQTITLTGDVTGTGTGSIATAIGALKVLGTMIANTTIDLTTKVTGLLPFANIANVATSTVMYRKTAGTGALEAQTLATLKTDLALTGTNSGDQTIANTSNATSHTITLSATGGSVQLAEGANITLTTTGTGADGIVTIASTGGGGGTPGGADTQVQFNDATVFGGDAGLTYNKTTDTLNIAGKIGVGGVNGGNASIEAKSFATGAIQGFRIEADNAANTQFSGFVTGDAFTRSSIVADGTIKWGSGAVVADTELYRGGANILKTPDKFEADGGVKIGTTSTISHVWTATDTLGNGSWQAVGGGGGGTTVLSVVPAGPGLDNWAPAGFSAGATEYRIMMAPTAPVWITGLIAGNDGQSVTLYNDSAFIVALCHNVSSTAANRFSTRRKTNWILPYGSVDMIYDSTLARWSVVGSTVDMLGINPNMNLIVAAGAATPSLYNVAVTNTATVSAVTANTTPTDDFNEQLAMQATLATANGSSGTFATSGLYARGATIGRGGVITTGQVRFTALGATGGVMTGLTSSTAVIVAQPSTLTNCILLGANGGQTTLRIFSGNATAGTPVDLGANFPVPSATAAYEYFFHLPPNSTIGYYMVRRLDSHFVAAGNVTSSPVNTTLVGPRSTIMVGATAAASTIQYNYMATRRILR